MHTIYCITHYVYFNSRPCERGDPILILATAIAHYFNSRPCERGDQKCGAAAGQSLISIHAPARGATQPPDPASRRDAFQFTPLREGRLKGRLRVAPVVLISIHAPARGATGNFSCSLPGNMPFQFTPLREGRLIFSSTQLIAEIFQFTPLREGRREAMIRYKDGTLFQFTPLREGRRNWQRTHEVINGISIHAPARGATTLLCFTRWDVEQFQFTPLREGRHIRSRHQKRFFWISIHAPARGATAKSNKICSVFSAIIEKNS